MSNFDTLDLDYIKKLSEEIGIKVLSITAPGDKITEELVDKILAIGASLETKVITFFPPHFADKDISWYKEYLPKIKKSENLSIAIENVEAKFLFFIIPARKNSSLIEIKKVTGDTSFNLSNSEDITKDANFLGDSIKNIYLSDTIGEKKGLLLGTSAGETSNLPIESLLMKLKANHYDGLFTIKINPNELGVGDEEKVIINFLIFLIFPVLIVLTITYISIKILLFLALFLLVIIFVFLIFFMGYITAVLDIFKVALWYHAYIYSKKTLEK